MIYLLAIFIWKTETSMRRVLAPGSFFKYFHQADLGQLKFRTWDPVYLSLRVSRNPAEN